MLPLRNTPEDGTSWKPSVSGNRVGWDGTSVVKSHVDPGGYAREHAILGELTEFPLPRLRTGSTPGALRMTYIDGLSSVEAVEAGRASVLLRTMGQFLRRLHAIEPRRVAWILPGDGEVVVHGDYGPHNALLDRESDSLAGILDWEGAFLGSRTLDLAWCEWQFRNRFPAYTYAIAALFEGYGETPPAALRERVVLARLAQLSGRRPALIEPALGRTIAFASTGEAAAFLAALSRFLNYPQGEPHRRSDVEIWRPGTIDPPLELLLSQAAVEASVAGFGAFPEVCNVARNPRGAVRLLRGDDVSPMGMTEALVLLDQRQSSNGL